MKYFEALYVKGLQSNKLVRVAWVGVRPGLIQFHDLTDVNFAGPCPTDYREI